MAAVVVKPFKKLSTVLAPKQAAATAGAPGAIVTNAPIVATLAPSNEEFTRCLPGSIVGLEDIRPASLRKATIEPVKVIPPKTRSVTSKVRVAPNKSRITYENSHICSHQMQG
jgi:hypothetical protein